MTEEEKVNEFMKDWKAKYNPFAPMTEDYYFENEEEIEMELLHCVVEQTTFTRADGTEFKMNLNEFLQSCSYLSLEDRDVFMKAIFGECRRIFATKIYPNFIKEEEGK